MKKVKLFIVGIFLYVVWIILNGNISKYTLLSGIVVSIVSIGITFDILELNVNNLPNIMFFKLSIYYLLLIKDIFISGISMIRKAFTPNLKPKIVSITTSLKNEKFIRILSKSITLTPGTITMNVDKNKLIILWLPDKNSNINDPKNEICKKLEERLMKMEG